MQDIVPLAFSCMNRRMLIRTVVILIAAAVAYWKGDDWLENGTSKTTPPPPSHGTAVLKEGPIPGIDAPKSHSDEKSSTTASVGRAEKVGAYDKLTGAQLVDHRGNDGDSFNVRAGGREFELRLYFADTPETYLSDRYESQRKRVEEQSHALGDISVEDTVEIGQLAKAFTEKKLKEGPFTIYTYWEDVYDSGRVYAFVELADGSDLATLLVKNGLARIHTKGPGSKEKPVNTPRGETFYQARDQLRVMEREAQQAKRGAWGR